MIVYGASAAFGPDSQTGKGARAINGARVVAAIDFVTLPHYMPSATASGGAAR